MPDLKKNKMILEAVIFFSKITRSKSTYVFCFIASQIQYLQSWIYGIISVYQSIIFHMKLLGNNAAYTCVLYPLPSNLV